MRSAVRLIPLVVLGALAAFLLVGPLASLYNTRAAASRPQPSASAHPSAQPSPTSCPASLPTPKQEPAVLPAPSPTLPFSVWVNDPLGVNLRTTPSKSGTLVRTLNQGTQASADRQVTDGSAARWYHVTIGSQSGWLRADFVVSHSISVMSGNGWSLMLPDTYQGRVISASLSEASASGDAVPFLRAQTSGLDTVSADLPAVINPNITPIPDHTKVVQVWSYTVLERVSRAPIDTCKVAGAGARQDAGWPYMTSVVAKSTVRAYSFTFFTQEPNSAIVEQVIESIALS
jgi:hypothetical protein